MLWHGYGKPYGKGAGGYDGGWQHGKGYDVNGGPAKGKGKGKNKGKGDGRNRTDDSLKPSWAEIQEMNAKVVAELRSADLAAGGGPMQRQEASQMELHGTVESGAETGDSRVADRGAEPSSPEELDRISRELAAVRKMSMAATLPRDIAYFAVRVAEMEAVLSEGRPLAARLTDAEKLHLEASQRVQRNRIHVEKANQSLAAALELLEERTMVLDRIKQEISATRAESDGASGRSLSPSASGSSQQGSAAHALTMLTNSVTHLAAVAQQQGGQVSLSMADIGQMLQAAAAAGTNAAPHDMSQVNSACPAPVTILTAEQRQAATPVGDAPLTPDHRVRGPAYPSPSPVRSEGGRGGAGTPARPQAFSIGDGDGDASAGDGDSSFAM